MQTLHKQLPQVWDLERIFKGGSTSKELARHLEQLSGDIEQLGPRIASLEVPQTETETQPLVQLIADLQELSRRLSEAHAFSSCLLSQDVADGDARIVSGQIRQLSATLDATLTTLDAQLVSVSDEVWQAFLQDEQIAPIAFGLEERRTRAKDRMSPDKEALVVELGVDGYHAWGQMYNLISGRMRVIVEEDGKQVALSVGQAANRVADPDRAVRERVFDAYEDAWAKEADLLAATLNNLAGYRLTLYRYRGWDSVIKEPLDFNRMTQGTLDAMWSAVADGKKNLVQYMNTKAALLGLDKLSWFDLNAPVGTVQADKIPYDEAARFIVEQFARFGPRLQGMAVKAFNEGWIEAEDRPGKGAGGFCTSFPVTGESRIFLTYGGRPQSVDTLAHELGHAYHFHVMRDLPPMARMYPMNLAETASTLGEMVVADGSLRAATDPQQRLVLLDNRLERAAAFMMDVHARYTFETGLYEERRKGPLGVDELNELMEKAQRSAFEDALDRYHPLFWASKLHFHITYMPFYNFPYTFGYLFSAGIYARQEEYGERFPDVVDALLRDTGRMGTEELAAKHLGVDLTKPEFWQSAVKHVLGDLDEFVALAGQATGS